MQVRHLIGEPRFQLESHKKMALLLRVAYSLHTAALPVFLLEMPQTNLREIDGQLASVLTGAYRI